MSTINQSRFFAAILTQSAAQAAETRRANPVVQAKPDPHGGTYYHQRAAEAEKFPAFKLQDAYEKFRKIQNGGT